MKKLLLINPVGRRSGYLLSRFSTFQPLSLAYVASVTPADWDVKIIDENFNSFSFLHADLVGITAFTSNINRAYEIARIYREKSVKVIIGGIHASMLPDEALLHADSVIIGEVEGIWQNVLTDFQSNRLKTKYIGPRIDFKNFDVIPRRSILHPSYFWNSVQTSRGCPFNCHFCSVSKYLGNEYRQRSVASVLSELNAIRGDYIAFLDDNLIGYSEESKLRSIDLFEAMIKQKLEKKWWMQTSINIASNEKVIEMAAKSGCMFVFIGFETIQDKALKEMKKGINLKVGVKRYKEVVKLFHKYGIAVLGAFIIGNDFESSQYYNELLDFMLTSGIDMFQISILTPLPGSILMSQYVEQDRLIYKDFPKDWDKYRFSYLVHLPNGIEKETVYIGDNLIKRNLYAFPAYQMRMLKSFFKLKKKHSIITTYKLNQALKKSWEQSHYFKAYPHDF